MFFGFVKNYLGLLDRDQSSARRLFDHPVRGFKKGFDLIVVIDYFEDDRQIERQIEQLCRMYPAARPIRDDAAEDGCSGDALFLRGPNKCLVQRLMVIFVQLADEDPQQLGIAFELCSHIDLISKIPR